MVYYAQSDYNEKRIMITDTNLRTQNNCNKNKNNFLLDFQIGSSTRNL